MKKESDYDDSSSEEELEGPVRKQDRIVVNVGDTQYPVVKEVCKRDFHWKLQHDKEALNWDLCWTDNAVQAETLGRMQSHQKINHFPGMYSLARKNNLARGLAKMKKRFDAEYNFFPQTWLLPYEFPDLKLNMESKQKGKARTYIAKPEAGCQGRGIFLTRSIESF
jgi:tubulin polyglutamylase TTLL6/13